MDTLERFFMVTAMINFVILVGFDRRACGHSGPGAGKGVARS
jgi:hypothetical protein